MLKLIFTLLLIAGYSYAQDSAATTEKSLDEKLQELNFPSNEVPVTVSKDKLYSVQDRLHPLTGKHEFAIDGGANLNIDGHISSNQVGALYRHHLTNRWSWGLNAYHVSNQLSASGERLKNDKGIVPEVDYVKSQVSLLGEYNLFYGKFRLSMDRVMYFDQYVALGPSMMSLASGNVYGATADIGLVFWLGGKGSVRLGFKNDFYNETTSDGTRLNHALIGHAAVGYLFGGK